MYAWRFAAPGPNEVEIVGLYDLRLVALSVVIAIAGALAMLRAVERFGAAETRSLRRIWAVSGAAAMGFGIWAMHFTGMIALMLPLPMEYNIGVTAASLVPAVLGSLAAVYVLGAPTLSSWHIHRGAVLLGGSIGTMHYAGMEAMRFEGTLHYDPGLFALSVAAAYALALLALRIRPVLNVGSRHRSLRDLASAVLLGGAVAAMHYTAMAAASFHATAATRSEHSHTPPFVIEGVIFGTVLILGVVWIASLVDRRLAAVGTSLRRSEALNRAVITAMPDAHLLADSNGRVLSINPAAAAMFGYAADEIVGTDVSVLVPDPQTPNHPSHLGRFLTTSASRALGKPLRGLSAVRKDGAVFPIELMFTDFEIDGERFFSGMVRDLSEYAATMATTKRLMAATDQAPDGIAILDPAMRVTYANPKFFALTGSRADEGLGHMLDDFAWKRADLTKLAEMHAQLRAGRVWRGTIVSTHSDGSPLHEAITTAPVVTDGRVGCYIHVRRDITEKIRMEQQLRHAQKLESIGQLSAGIAHELNTPSQFVRDNIVFLKDGYRQLVTLIETASNPGVAGDRAALAAAIEAADLDYLREEIPRAIEQSIEGMNRITNIVRAMKEFSHQGKEKTPADLNRAIESTITVATSEWKYVADVELDLDPMLPPVPCLLDEFNQAVLNIVVNAAHAIAETIDAREGRKGKIRVATRTVDEYVELRIADTGTGMTPEVKARIFEPFFTTKEIGRGTGQGLSIAYAVIVEKHKGSIGVETELGKGSCFVIRMPLSGAEPRRASAAA
jgi:PAS domain S-box-containing protein